MTARTLALHVAGPAGASLRALYWLVMAALSGLIVHNALPFFTFDPHLPFLLEKTHAASDPAWRACFYVHVAGGIVCLVVAPLQFNRRVLRRAPRAHRVLGWTYVVSVLVGVVPPGLYLAIHAKGGFTGRLGFVVLGVALLYSTWRGIEHVRRRDFRGHVPWMLRSYAMAASAVSFRVFYLALDALGFDALDSDGGYVLAIWLSFFVNLLLAELVIALRQKGTLT